jgi:hypothetical protein
MSHVRIKAAKKSTNESIDEIIQRAPAFDDNTEELMVEKAEGP